MPGPATDVVALTHLYDEVLSHYLWHAALIGLAVLLIYREWHRPTGQETAWRPTGVGGLIYGLTLFSIFLEGGTVAIGMPFTAGVLVFGLLWGRGVVAKRPVLAFFGIAGHRVEALGEGRARLTLTLDMRGFLIPIMALFYKNLTNRYMNLEAEGMKRAAESA